MPLASLSGSVSSWSRFVEERIDIVNPSAYLLYSECGGIFGWERKRKQIRMNCFMCNGWYVRIFFSQLQEGAQIAICEAHIFTHS
jgi:hypothetical protein